MKFSLFIFLFTILSSTVNAQVAADYQASTGGIGPFKIGMTRAEAMEKLLNTKQKLPNSSQIHGHESDTIQYTYKKMDVQLVFHRQYFGNDTSPREGIYSISSSYTMVKTKSGVGIGDDKAKIVKTYNLYRLDISPEWQPDGKPNPKRATVTLYDNESPNMLIFYLDNNIITAICSTVFEGD